MYELDIPIWAVKDKTILVNVHISFPLPGTSELQLNISPRHSGLVNVEGQSGF